MSEHAIQNAKAWLETIVELEAALDAETFPVEANGQSFDDLDSLKEHVMELPLSVEVRDGWHTLGGSSAPEEYLVLLSTGGPALRIYGDLDQDNCPATAQLQWQDWGTLWTDLETTPEEAEAILAFAQEFYYED